MVGILNGYTTFKKLGYQLIQLVRHTGGRGRKNTVRDLNMLLGILFYLLGFFGEIVSSLLRAAFNRQREWLADATAVQFTRNQGGIRGALIKIDQNLHKKMSNVSLAEGYSHMCLVKAVTGFWSVIFASHPSITKRIRKLGQPDYVSPKQEDLIDYENSKIETTDQNDLIVSGVAGQNEVSLFGNGKEISSKMNSEKKNCKRFLLHTKPLQRSRGLLYFRVQLTHCTN